MSQNQNFYLSNRREVSFVLFEQFGLDRLLATSLYQRSFDVAGARQVLDEAYKFATEVVGPLNGSADMEGCRVENGEVKTPKGFKEAWTKLYEAGLRTTGTNPEHGGMGAPLILAAAVEEMLCGANTSFNMYPGLAMGAAEVIEQFGSPAQKKLYLEKMYSGTWGGTMCLTEPHAGTDVGSARTKAIRQADGTFLISGTKMFISGGDHDLADNIIHLVLARIEGAPAGTKGLSLFIVSKHRVAADGTCGGSNDVSVGRIEHKMGLNGSATCVMNYGENGGCIGEVVGGTAGEGQGMRQMFLLMNAARIAVGLQSLGVASTAFLNALKYTRERKQGPSIKHFKDPTAPRVPIIEHADVRRMLLDMKSRVEGIRALVFKLAYHRDCHEVAVHEKSGDANYHLGQIELLTPVVKAYASDQAFRICETAIQTMGGVGFTADYGVEQYCRDSKVFSIYEGTNHIQAMDLVSRKLTMQNGAFAQAFQKDIETFVAAHKDHPTYGAAVLVLSQASKDLQAATGNLMTWFLTGSLELVPLYANKFLEMLAETTIGWLLLQQAVLAANKRAELPEGHADHAFYEGKHYAALFFVNQVLPGVGDKARSFERGDRSPLEISDAAFGMI